MDKRIYGLVSEYGIIYTSDGKRTLPAEKAVRYLFEKLITTEGFLNVFLENGARFYLVHSYFAVIASGATLCRSVGRPAQEGRGSDTPDTASEGAKQLRIAWCDYGVRFAAAIEMGQVWATQFHPEKSQAAGIRVLKNFAAIVKEQR